MINVLFSIIFFLIFKKISLSRETAQKPKELCANCVQKFSACLTLVQAHEKHKEFSCNIRAKNFSIQKLVCSHTIKLNFARVLCRNFQHQSERKKMLMHDMHATIK